MSQTLMLIGGSDRTNGDHSWLLSHEGAERTWSCPKNARVGDTVLIYIAAPVSEVIATARVTKAPVEGARLNWKWRYVARIGPISLLKSPISIADLRRLCPKWRWLNYPRAYAYIPPREARTITRRAQQRVTTNSDAEAARIGAGFGDAESNRRVEKASVRAVRRFYQQRGFEVTSYESKNLGYDLEVAKGHRKLHVEVKGISSGEQAFPITRNEVRCAIGDKSFRLAIVTHAVDAKRRRVRVLTGRSFLRRFQLRELSYVACLKLNGRKR